MHHQRTISELIRTAKALQAKAEQAQEKSEQYQVSLGLTLAELKERKPKGITWPAFVEKHFSYSRSRADELIQIASGSTSVGKVRERVKDTMQKSRVGNPPTRVGGKLSVISSTSVQRSAAKKKNQLLDGEPLNIQSNKLVGELSEFVDYWEEKTKRFWEDNRETLEREKGKEAHESSRGSILLFIETNAMKLWGLGQALDGR